MSDLIAQPAPMQLGRLAKLGFWTAAIGVYTYYVFKFFNSLDDDALIPFRYALNFLGGHGWGLNPGEHVEGVTSPLHLWLLTLELRYFSPDQAITFLKILGSLSGIGVLACVRQIAKIVAPRIEIIGYLAVLFLGLHIHFALSMINGLETPLATLFATGGLWLFLREKEAGFRDRVPASAVVLALAALARPELTLLLPILVAVSVRGRAFSGYLITFGIPVLAFLIWRISYYGDILPNTYYAKALPPLGGMVDGIGYLENYGSPFLLPFVFVLPLTLGFGGQALRSHFVELMVAIFVPIVFVLLSGGSYMPDGRFLAPAMPFLAILGAAAVYVVATAKLPLGMRAITVGLVALLLTIGMAVKFAATEAVFGMAAANEMSTGDPYIGWRCAGPQGRRLMADWIHKNVPPGALVATTEMGVPTVLNMDVRFIDVRGLSDRTVARMHRDVGHSNIGVSLDDWTDFDNELLTYVLRRQPYAIVAFDGGGGSALANNYRKMAAFTMPETGWLVTAWLRNDVIPPIRGNIERMSPERESILGDAGHPGK